MAEESIDEILARLEGQGAFVGAEPVAPRAVLASGQPASDYGDTGNLILGLSRSALAGPTFGLSKRAEAAIAAPFSERTYGEILADINAQQRAFQQEYPILGTGTEIATGYALNPLAAIGAAGKGISTGAKLAEALPTLTRAATTSERAADVLTGLTRAGEAADVVLEKVPFARIAQQAVSNVPAQAFATGYFGADPTISSPFIEGLKTGAVGIAGSAISNVAGRGLSALGREADRLTLSKYGITAPDIKRTLKKAEVAGKELPEVADIPVLKTVKDLEAKAVINAEDDILNNIRSIGGYQDEIGYELRDVLKAVDVEADAFPDFQDKYTKKFINSFAGKAREEVAAAAKAEREALRGQFKAGGSILDLQDAKTGLNYSWNNRPYTADVQKAIRADLRDEIEKRVDDLATRGRVDADFAGKVRELNESWGQAADLKDVFSRKAGNDLGGNIVEDFFLNLRTTGASGSLNIMSAASGSVLPMAIGKIADVARTTKGKEFLENTFRDPAFQKLGSKLGELLQQYGTGRAYSQAAQAVTQTQKERETKQQKAVDLELFRQGGAAPAAGAQISAQDYNDILDILRKAPAEGSAKVEKKEISAGGKTAPVRDLILKEDPFIQSIISVESRGNPNAKSEMGAEGLMQIMPATAKDLGLEDRRNPSENIRAGKTYINQQLKKFDDPDIAVAAYNWGPGNVARALRRLEDRGVAATWENLKKYTKIPKETLEYVTRRQREEEKIREQGAAYWDKILKA